MTDYLAQAIDLAERGRGTAHPNPVVGAVVVRDGEVVGEGWHERYTSNRFISGTNSSAHVGDVVA